MSKEQPFYGYEQVSVRMAPGVVRAIDDAAHALGVERGQYIRAAFALTADDKGILRLAVREPGPQHIGVVGSRGFIVSTLAQLLEGTASIDGDEDMSPGDGAAKVQPIIVDGVADLERDAGGKLTGRIARVGGFRQPGRRRAVKVARARAALDALTSR